MATNSSSSSSKSQYISKPGQFNPITADLINKGIIKAPTKSSGGGGISRSSSPSAPMSSPNPLLNTPAPQVQSQQKQDQSRTLAQQNLKTEDDALGRDVNYTFQNPNSIKSNPFDKFPIGQNYSPTPLQISNKPTSAYTQLGFLPVTNEEAKGISYGKGTSIPFYAPQSNNFQDIISESNIIGKTPVYSSSFGKQTFFNTIDPTGLLFNRGVSEGQIKSTDISFQGSKEQLAFSKDPYSFIGKSGVAPISKNGESFIDASSYFNSKNNEYAKIAKSNFEALPLSTKFGAVNTDVANAIGGAGVYTFDMGVSLAQTAFLKNTPKDNSVFNVVADYKANKYTSPLSYQYESTPLGIAGKYTNTALLVGGGIDLGLGIGKGIQSAKLIYNAERELGVSRLGAVNTLGGEVFFSGLYRDERIIGLEETKLKPYSTSQFNKGYELTSIKTGEIGKAESYTILNGVADNYTPSKLDYLSFKPQLTGLKLSSESLDTSGYQLVSLKNNVFNVVPTDKDNLFKVYGNGQREVFSVSQEVYQDTKYKLNTRVLTQRDVQQFTSYGKALQYDLGNEKQLSVNFDRSFFKTTERYNYFGGYKLNGKEFLPSISESGKAFGLGIPGRPSKSIGGGFNIQVGRIDTEKGSTIFGKSFSKYLSGGKRGVQFFNTKTLIPKDNFFNIQLDKNFDLGGRPFDLTTYHGTDNVASKDILSAGLKPFDLTGKTNRGSLLKSGELKSDTVFVARTQDNAKGYANSAYTKGLKGEVLKVGVYKENLIGSFEKPIRGGEIGIKGSIPKEQISVLKKNLIDGSSRNTLTPLKTNLENFKTVSPSKSFSNYGFASLQFNRQFNNLNSKSYSSFANAQVPRLSSNQISTVTQAQITSQAQTTNQLQQQDFQFSNPTTSGGGDFNFRFSSPTNLQYGAFADMPQLGGYVIPNRRKKKRKNTSYDIAPSFSAIIQNIKIKSPLKVNSKLGVTPFQTRGLLVGKKASGSYFKFTDL